MRQTDVDGIVLFVYDAKEKRMKIKIKEKEKIVCWIIIGFFAIMGILMMLKPLRTTVEASEIAPVTEPQIQKVPIVIDFKILQ